MAVLRAAIGDVLGELLEMNSQLSHAFLHQLNFHMKVEIIIDT